LFTSDFLYTLGLPGVFPQVGVDKVDEIVPDGGFEDGRGLDLADGGAFFIVDGDLRPSGGEHGSIF